MEITNAFVEKYKPSCVSELILPDRLKTLFQQFVDRKEIDNHIFCGSPGVGKTSSVIAMCKEIGCDYMLINGSKESGIDTLREKISSYASSMSLSGGKKVIIIDEADYLNANSTQPALRGVIEEVISNCSFILTCNYKNRLIPALHSRCPPVDFTLQKSEKVQLALSFYKRIVEILKIENIDFEQQVLGNLINKYFPDFRQTLNVLQMYAKQHGGINSGILSQIKDVDIKDLVSYLREKDFVNTKKWVTDNSDLDIGALYRKLYDKLSTYLEPESFPQVVLIIAKYQYQAAFAMDQSINFLACLIEIMIEAEFLAF